MNQPPGRIRAPVKREKAEQYLLIMMISFAGSILLTRLFLELTGYPQIGNSELHIAHVLWGGLFLFAAVFLPLAYANQWAILLSAILGGIVFGLIIDEIGKFITQSNDYFYPMAAPIVYTLFLITVFIYLRVKRRVKTTPRDELYRALQNITELLDNDMDEIERAALQTRLENIHQNADTPSIKEFSSSMLQFIRSGTIQVVPPRESEFLGFLRNIVIQANRILTRARLRWLLILMLGWVGVIAALDLYNLGQIAYRLLSRFDLAMLLLAKGDTSFASTPIWFSIRLAVQGTIGLLALLAAIAYLLHKDHLATTLAILGLTVSLAGVEIIIFYLDQFSAAIGALIQLIIFLAVMIYRRRFLDVKSTEAAYGLSPAVTDRPERSYPDSSPESLP